MQYVAPGASFEAVADWGTTSLVGTIGVKVVDNVGGTTITRTTAGITEIAPGTYAATLTAPAAAGQYSIIWDDLTAFASDELTVTTSTAVPIGITDDGLSFSEIVDIILENRFRDNTINRSRCKRMVNDRYVRLVGLEDWVFRYLTAAVTVTGGTRNVTNIPADFSMAISLWDQSGQPLTYVMPAVFYDLYQSDTSTSNPWVYTVLNGAIIVAPTPGTSSTAWQLLYQRGAILMVDDTDVPIIPKEYRYVLVHGGRADMLADHQDPSWQDEEGLWNNGVDSMRRDLLTDVESHPDIWAADPTWSTWSTW